VGGRPSRLIIARYQQAVILHHEHGDGYYEATTPEHLGDAYHAASDPTAARASWQQAAEIFDDLDRPDAAQVHAKLTTLQASAGAGFYGREDAQLPP
jgi:predicted negative regulator of RcsB-dependent stress response